MFTGLSHNSMIARPHRLSAGKPAYSIRRVEDLGFVDGLDFRLIGLVWPANSWLALFIIGTTEIFGKSNF